MTTVIGISGYAQSGKTTAANYIEARYGVIRRHIAEPLRDMLAVLLRRAGVAEDMIPRYLTGDLKEAYIPEIGRTSRELQISLGTEWGRVQVHPDLWARIWKVGVGPWSLVMNDSVRFPNEEVVIDDLGGFTIMILRPNTHPIAFKWGWFGRQLYRLFGCMWGVHDSERTDRLAPDYIIPNDGPLERLHDLIDEIMASEGVAVVEGEAVLDYA